MKFIGPFLFLFFLYSACSNNAAKTKAVKKNQYFSVDDITRIWRSSEVLSVDAGTDEQKLEGFVKSLIEDKFMSDGYVISLFPDFTFSELTGYDLEYGKWNIEKDTLFLEGNLYGTKKMILKKMDAVNSRDYLTVVLELGNNSGNVNLKFADEAKMLNKFQSDPFYPDNNFWRIKPDHKESDEEIKTRLLNYILHYSQILNSSSERKSDVISFNHSLGIIKVYRGGIGRAKIQNIPESWIDCFYEPKDAIRAYDLFSEYLEKGLYKGASTGDWLKDDYQILMTIHRKMKNDI